MSRTRAFLLLVVTVFPAVPPVRAASDTPRLLAELEGNPIVSAFPRPTANASDYGLVYGYGRGSELYIRGALELLHRYQARSFVFEPKAKLPKEPPPFFRAVFAVLKTEMRSTLRASGSVPPASDIDRLVEDYFDAFDIRGSMVSTRVNGTSGLPFFERTVSALGDPSFLERALQLQTLLLRRASRLAEEIAAGRGFDPGTVFDLALEASRGKESDAIAMLGILLSRETRFAEYFPYLSPAPSAEVLRRLAEIPVLVRLVSELDRFATKSPVDRFAYDGAHVAVMVKNYYFWSAALSAQELSVRGHHPRSILIANLDFTRSYKKIRRLLYHRHAFEAAGAGAAAFLSAAFALTADPAFWSAFPVLAFHAAKQYSLAAQTMRWPVHEFRNDFFQVAFSSGKGARFSLLANRKLGQRRPITEDCETLLERAGE